MRWRRRRFIELLVNLQVASLNFLNGRGGEWAFGIPLNLQQSNVVDNLVLRARSLSRLGRDDFLGCGSKVATAATELDALQVLFSDAEDLPYGVSSFVSTKREDSVAAVVEPLVASKVAFPSTLQGFDPLPYLGETSKLAYHHPSSLLGWKEELSTKMMSPDAVSKETRRELHLLGRRWDDVDRLTLALFSEIDVRDRCNLFCIAKPDGELRQIIDRRPRNARELPPPRDGAKMGHPSSFLGIIIPEGYDLVGSLDDLRNFYHEFVVSSDRAFSTPVGPFWSLNQWQGTKACNRLKERYPARTLKGDTPVLMRFQGLSMGDHWAPTIAQESHENLLSHFDALRPEEHIRFGQLFPRAPLGHVSGVCVDDKVNIQLVPAGKSDVFLRDSEACEAGDRAYSAAGLTFHPRKRIRRASTFTAWGAEIQGKEGLLGAKRSRLCSLAFASGLAAKSPALTRRVVEVLLGCWAFCFQFRRPLFSIIHDLYHVGSPDGKHDTPFSPPHTVRQELLLLSILGPTALAQLRCPVCPTLFGSDASPEGAGVVKCRVGSQTAQELFRRSDPRGFHTRVLPKIAAYLHEQGLPVPGHLVSNDFDDVKNSVSPSATLFEESPPLDTPLFSATQCKTVWTRNQEVLSEAHKLWSRIRSPVELQGAPDMMKQRELSDSGSPSKTLGVRFDFLEISVGCGRMSKAFADKGMVVAPPIEFKQGMNMSNSSLFHLILALSVAQRISILWLHPPCATFSVIRNPQIRSVEEPLGFDLLNIDTLTGNFHMHLALALWLAQLSQGRLALLKIPWGAFARHLPWWQHMISLGGVVARLDQCQFESPYKLSAGILGSHPALEKLTRRCCGGHAHDKVPDDKIRRQTVYPAKICDFVAAVVSDVLRLLHGRAYAQRSCKDHSWPEEPLKDPKTLGRFVSHLWSTHLSESLPWKVLRKYRFKKTSHINLLEVHARKSLLLSLAPNQRFVLFQDSMVALGAGAKGRSSSASMNRLLQQEMTILVAKDLYPGGIHTPTWALRADDPSRGRKVRSPRVCLPKWLHAMWQNRVSEAQDLLDQASQNARSLGRWLLFVSAARLSVSGGYASIGSWAAALRTSEGSGRPAKGKSDRCYGHIAIQTAGRVPTVGSDPGQLMDRHETSSTQQSHYHCRSIGGIWKDDVRAGKQPPQLCRNDQCCSSGFSFSAPGHEWTLAVGDHMGDHTPICCASSNSTTSDDGYGRSGIGVEVVSNGFADLNRLLCFAETCRNVFAEARALQPQLRDWQRRRLHHPFAADEKSHPGCEAPKRQTRRAIRDCFLRKMFSTHAQIRANLALLGKPLSN